MQTQSCTSYACYFLFFFFLTAMLLPLKRELSIFESWLFALLGIVFKFDYTQRNIYYSFPLTYIYLLHFNHLTTPLAIINKDILINKTHFTIKINTSNYFLNNRVNLKRDT